MVVEALSVLLLNNGDETGMHNFNLSGILILVGTFGLIYFVLRSLLRKR